MNGSSTEPRVQIALAPMEGVVDARMRALLTAVGGIDWCVTEFIRVTRQHLPAKVFHTLAPELRGGARTPAGTPVHVQLLGSDPDYMADNAVRACELGAPVIDLNFGCPAKTVNQSRGGAVLLDEPELLHAIVRAVRSAVPAQVPVTAKMRLGYTDTQRALDCAHALADGGAAEIVVHARTKLDGYQPPAHWEWIACIAEAIAIPVYANGEIWSVEDWRRCRAISGVNRFMLGRGLVAQPDLARQIAAAAQDQTVASMPWAGVLGLLSNYWQGVRDELSTRHAPGRIKQWLFALARNYPQAQALFDALRRERDCAPFDAQFDPRHAAQRSTRPELPTDEVAPADSACA